MDPVKLHYTKLDKTTENKIRLAEDGGDDPLFESLVGPIYFPKGVLRQWGWKEGDDLQVTFEVVKGGAS